MRIGNFEYRVVSAIFLIYSKNLIPSYSCMVRDGTTGWINIQDESVVKRKWPRNSTNALIFILEAS